MRIFLNAVFANTNLIAGEGAGMRPLYLEARGFFQLICIVIYSIIEKVPVQYVEGS